MSKIKFFTDSACDLPKNMVEEADITILPFLISFEDETLREYYDISPTEFYKKMEKTKIIPKTAQVTPAVFEEAFKDALKTYDTVIYISLSSTLTGTFASANIAKNAVLEENPDADIVLIDSKSATSGYGIIAYRAALMAKEGKSKEEITEYIEKMQNKMKIYFVIDDLSYLQKGGRISSTKLMMGTLLDIKPLLKLDEGQLVQFDKIRGKKNVNNKLCECALKDIETYENYSIVFGHTNCPEKLQEFKSLLLSKAKAPVFQMDTDVGCAIGAHGGPGIIAVFFWEED